jgi:hypothetical protein
MRFVYTALAFFLLLLNLAMISSLAHFTPGVMPGLEKSANELSHVTLQINHVGEINRQKSDATSAASIVHPTASVLVVDNSKVERSAIKSIVEIISRMSMSHTVWVLMSAGLILILAIPDVTHLYSKVARKKK